MLWNIIWLLIVLLIAVAGIGGIGWLNVKRRLREEDLQHIGESNLEEGTNNDHQTA